MTQRQKRQQQRQDPPNSPAAPAVPAARSFTRRLLHWFRLHARPLPWRATRDPYRVLVSEFMLQQTQVSRVEQFYPRFLARYPALADLARAKPARVREAWEGLGYYARARNLHRLAQEIVKNHGGRIPEETAALRDLPGVGPYTAGAVASFAFEKREAAVDTNVRRVLERAFTNGGRGGTRPGDIWALARKLLPRNGRVAWEFNQGLMDLGARICMARKPRCPECPVRQVCRTGRKRTPV